MDSGPVDSPVTLVIKAPNQKYEDQTINCFLNWTVERLKSHISKVYPSKPSSKDQRLVYSGRLLQDHLQLRDVLRKQDEYHMMHLVCASHSPPPSPLPRSPSMAASAASDASSSEGAGSSSAAGTPGLDTPQAPLYSSSSSSTSSSSSSSSAPGSDDGLRYRGGYPHYNPHSPPAVAHWPDGGQVPLQGGQLYLPMQMLWWQQMYARQYYLQYQAAVAASRPPSTPPPSPPSSSPHQPPRANEAVQPALGPNRGAAAAAAAAAAAGDPLPENPPAPAPAPPAANANIQMNAQGGAVLNDDELNRDWLDWLYTVSRASVLLSIVYFYSSFSRFVMVVGAMLLVYLHQAGWFPFRAEQQNLGGGQRREPAQEEADRHQDIQEIERLMDEGLEDDDSSDEGGGAQEEPAQAAAAGAAAPPPAPEPGFLTVAWSFISTFFTSLIPDGRPHPAN